VLLRKPRSVAEVYNDLDSEIVNVFAMLRDPETAGRLRIACELTPFARDEFHLSYEAHPDPVEQARRTIARSFMAHGTSHRRGSRSGFRATQVQRSSTSAEDWRTWPAYIPQFVDRLRGVIIDNRDAHLVIAANDKPDTLFFCDPPYPRSTRSSLRGHGRKEGAYLHEMSDDDHRALAIALHGISGMAIICGYACELYDRELYADWQRVELPTLADGAKPRIEVLYINPAAAQARAAAPTAPAASSAADQRGGMSRVARPHFPSPSVPTKIPG
jgi:DNA adenine methylase